jgi:hyperosmotically inducible protein
MRHANVLSTLDLVGLRVCNSAGEKLGKIEDLILDPAYNRIAYAVISPGGVAGLEERTYAVPMEALTLAPGRDCMILDVERSVLERGPIFDRGRAALHRPWLASTYAHYGYRPYWEDGARTMPPPAAYTTGVVHSRAGSSAVAALLTIVLLVAVGMAYMVYTRGWPSTRDRITTTAQAAFTSVEEGSKDAATTARVKTAFALSKRVSAFDINVDSHLGVVTLNGQVPSEEVKEIAAVIARDTSGVTEVRNQLTVNPSASPSATRESLGDRVADLEVKAVVRDGISRDPNLASKNIDVAVQKQVVTLNGTVDTTDQKNSTERMAWAAGGVKGVTNNLTVRTPSPAAESEDDRLAKRVEFALYSTTAFDMPGLQVRAHQGTVVLGGSVRSQAEKLLAEKVAQGTEGVKRVENNLSMPVAQAGLRPEPNLANLPK